MPEHKGPIQTALDNLDRRIVELRKIVQKKPERSNELTQLEAQRDWFNVQLRVHQVGTRQ